MKGNALITGGTRGIGLGIAEALAKAGYNLALNGTRPPEEITSIIAELKNNGIEVEYFQADLSNDKAAEELILKVLDRFKTINILVNNAGVAPEERLDALEVSGESFDRVMTVNLKAPFFLTQQTSKHMIAQLKIDSDFKASMINIGSVSANMVSLNRAEYCISKAGLGMLTKIFALRLAPHGIPVYEIRPGVIKTDMTSGVIEQYEHKLRDGLYFQNRVGLPEDVGVAVRALIKGEMPYSTGQVIYIDGGISIPRL